MRCKILAIDWNQEEAFDVFGSWMIGNESEFDFGLSTVEVLCRRDVDAVCPSSFYIILDFFLILEHFLAKSSFFRQKSCFHTRL